MAWAYKGQKSLLLLSFLAHQAHYMSSSVAYALGVKIEDIMKAAIWSYNTVFISTYLRDVRTLTDDGFKTKYLALANQEIAC